jgi:hypothetical protein
VSDIDNETYTPEKQTSVQPIQNILASTDAPPVENLGNDIYIDSVIDQHIRKWLEIPIPRVIFISD